jgi:hypothetical protein
MGHVSSRSLFRLLLFQQQAESIFPGGVTTWRSVSVGMGSIVKKSIPHNNNNTGILEYIIVVKTIIHNV